MSSQEDFGQQAVGLGKFPPNQYEQRIVNGTSIAFDIEETTGQYVVRVAGEEKIKTNSKQEAQKVYNEEIEKAEKGTTMENVPGNIAKQTDIYYGQTDEAFILEIGRNHLFFSFPVMCPDEIIGTKARDMAKRLQEENRYTAEQIFEKVDAYVKIERAKLEN